jgi:hypothetical protein
MEWNRPMKAMDEALTPLILDFLEWFVAGPRPYTDVMDAWKTSCPRLTVWEDATDLGLVARTKSDGRERYVELTGRGRDFLRLKRGVATKIELSTETVFKISSKI